MSKPKQKSRNTKKPFEVKKGTIIKKIPKNKLNFALEIANDPKHLFWKDKIQKCARDIHQRGPGKENSKPESLLEAVKLEHLRRCLLRRDWHNMARMLSICNPTGPRFKSSLFPLFIRYAAILLVHDESMFTSFINALSYTANPKEVLDACTQYPNLK